MLTYDQALPVFAQIVLDHIGQDGLASNFFLRDVSGKLTFIVPDGFDPAIKSAITSDAEDRVQPYVDDDGVTVASPSDLFDDRLVSPRDILNVRVDLAGSAYDVRVVDRRMVGADWVRSPSALPQNGRRLAFTSLKGGVGRSTALCVLASALVDDGKRVLVVDLDLEAPGLGSMLLSPETLPRFGMLDYLVERNVQSIDDDFVEQMIGSSWLGSGRGLLDVVPALGSCSIASPENVLGKIARAYLAGVDDDGNTTTFSDHVGEAIDRLAIRLNYDAVLIDARAGLHETTAASILGLGARVLCFGLDQPQTYADYRLLFSHLATVSPRSGDVSASSSEPDHEPVDGNAGAESGDKATFDWSEALIVVQGKANAQVTAQKYFAQQMTDLFHDCLQPDADPLSVPVEVDAVEQAFDVDWDSSASATTPSPEERGLTTCRILNDDRYLSFNPLAEPDTLDQSVYMTTYGPFLSVCYAALDIEIVSS